MPKQRFDVEVPEGHHLGYSRDTDGARRAHLFRDDTNELAGHAELFEVDDEWSPTTGRRDALNPYLQSQRMPVSYRLAEDVVDAVLERVTPHAEAAAARAGDALRSWCLETAFPACKSAVRTGWTKLTYRHTSDPQAEMPVASPVPTESVPADGSVMSSHEAQVRLVAAAVARAFSDEQLRIVLGAQIADGGDLVPRENALDTLTTGELEHRAQLLIEANPSFLAEFVDARGGRATKEPHGILLGSRHERTCRRCLVDHPK